MTTSSPVLSKALAHLTCPLCLARCEGQPFLDLKNNQALQCPVCGRLYPIRQGIIDFFPDYEETIKPGLAQRFMENNAIVAVYEKYFRPAFTSLGSPITYAEEVQWLRSVSPGISVKNILDLASGTGKYARLLNQTHDPELVFAVDISLPMLRKGLANARAE